VKESRHVSKLACLHKLFSWSGVTNSLPVRHRELILKPVQQLHKTAFESPQHMAIRKISLQTFPAGREGACPHDLRLLHRPESGDDSKDW
jgi:hypothetical protein